MTGALLTGPAATRPPEAAELHLGIAGLLVAIGGLLLGLQVDGRGALVGTGFGALGIGALVAVIATLLQALRSHSVPRDLVSGFSALCGFCGVSFLVAGVLAPGGGWMFFEVLLLVVLLARKARGARPAAPVLGGSTAVVLVVMLLFRLWVTQQGSQHRWQVLELEIPILSALPFDILAPVQTIQLGEFTPQQLGFPPAGLSFGLSLVLWSAGFALCVSGLLWRTRAALEHENDRVHHTIHELPPRVAALVERLLPEEDWPELGLHGLSDRMRRKRIEALVAERLRRRREIDANLKTLDLLTEARPEGFPGEIVRTLLIEAPESGHEAT